jgi:hypothetical protein
MDVDSPNAGRRREKVGLAGADDERTGGGTRRNRNAHGQMGAGGLDIVQAARAKRTREGGPSLWSTGCGEQMRQCALNCGLH